MAFDYPYEPSFKDRDFEGIPTPDFTSETLPPLEKLPVGQMVTTNETPILSNGQALQQFAIRETALRNVHGRLTNGYIIAGNYEDPSGRTQCVSMQMEAQFDRVRILLCNNKTSGSSVYGPACVSVTSQVTSNEEMRNNSATPVAIKWGGNSTVTIPAATNAATPQYMWSDWIDISSIAPADGSGRPWVCIRVYVPYEAAFHAQTSNDSDLWRTTPNGGRWVAGAYGDFVTSNYSGFTASFSAGNQQTAILGAQGACSGSVFNIAGFGDSLLNGYGAGVTQFGKTMFWNAKEEVTRTFGIPVGIMNYGGTGQTSSQYFARLVAEVDNLNASAILYTSYTTNDGGPTAATLSAAKGRVAEVIRMCRSRGIIPIIWSPRVNNGWDSNMKLLIKDYRDELKATPGVIMFDEYSATVDPATNGLYTTMTNDNVHLNEVGVAAATPELVKAFKQALYGSQLIPVK